MPKGRKKGSKNRAKFDQHAAILKAADMGWNIEQKNPGSIGRMLKKLQEDIRNYKCGVCGGSMNEPAEFPCEKCIFADLAE